MYFLIAKPSAMDIIRIPIGVSSNGRTRDFGSLYHGSNPCAPTKINNTARQSGFSLDFQAFRRVRMFDFEFNQILKTFELNMVK